MGVLDLKSLKAAGVAKETEVNGHIFAREK